MPARMSPGQTRSTLLSQGPGGSEKSARGSVMRIGTANVGTLNGRDGEVVNMANRRCLDFCCLQETRWKGAGARKFGKYKLLWSGCETGMAGVGLLVEENWVDKVLEVQQVSSRTMVVRVRAGKSVLNIVSVYAPQVGRTMDEKEEF